MGVVWIILFVLSSALICDAIYQRNKFKKKVKKIPYTIPSTDHAVAYGLLTCENCRHKTTCFETYPNVFPDFKHKCGANFTFEGAYFHYTLADERIPLNSKKDERE